MVAVLADLGGTNLRLARGDSPESIATFLIRDYPSFESVLESFAPDASSLYLASAITPLKEIIEDRRFSADSHWRIDLAALKRRMRVTVLNDLEAAAYGLARVDQDALPVLIKPTAQQTQFSCPPKILISIGTGIGHAYIFEKPGWPPLVQRTHGGWIPPMAATEEQYDVMARMRALVPAGRDMVMEDLASGRALWSMLDLYGKKDGLRLFWEFMGLYCNALVTASGAYGGVYLSGGVIDDMAADQSFDAASFRAYFVRPLVDSVVESLSATPVRYCHDVNLPVLGLAEYRKAHE